jgi:hypothetical protein
MSQESKSISTEILSTDNKLAINMLLQHKEKLKCDKKNVKNIFHTFGNNRPSDEGIIIDGILPELNVYVEGIRVHFECHSEKTCLTLTYSSKELLNTAKTKKINIDKLEELKVHSTDIIKYVSGKKILPDTKFDFFNLWMPKLLQDACLLKILSLDTPLYYCYYYLLLSLAEITESTYQLIEVDKELRVATELYEKTGNIEFIYAEANKKQNKVKKPQKIRYQTTQTQTTDDDNSKNTDDINLQLQEMRLQQMNHVMN